MILNTDEQSKREHIRTDLDRNLFIEAGAGAGKTTLLVDRAVNLLRRPGVLPEQIAVITFTNAAAGELYERISGKLRHLAGREDATEQIRDAYAHIDRINISTIHHFCHMLLSQRIFEAGLAMDLVMEEQEDTDARKDRFLEEYMSRSSAKVLRDLRAAFGWNYAGSAKDLFHRLSDRKDAEYIYNEKLAAIAADTMRERAYRLCRRLYDRINDMESSLREEGIAPELSGSQKGQETYDSLQRAVREYETGRNRDLVFGSYHTAGTASFQLFRTPRGRGNQELKAENRAFGEFAEALISGFEAEFNEWKADQLLLYVLGAVEEYQKKPEAKYISNDRLLYETQALLRDDGARRYLKERYRYLFVDEYQDTDDMQTEIIWSLAMEEGNPGALRDGALVVVGDPKQAIYRFRGADSTLFEKTRARMQGLSNVLDVTLQDNYRSSDSIITWVNERFSSLWGQSCVPMREGSARASFGRESSDPDGAFLCGAYFCSVGDGKEKPHDLSAVISLVQDLTDGTHQIAVREGSGYISKTVGYEDILILTWDTTEIPHYVSAFKRAGIPANVYGAITFEETWLLRFAALLQYLADPGNLCAMANARQALGHRDLESMGSGDSAALDASLGALRAKTRSMAPKAVLHFLAEHMELWMDWDVETSPNDFYNAGKTVINMAEQVCASDLNSLREISDWVQKYVDDRHERESEISADVKQLRLMNIHKAKGLEGHIVIIADRDDGKKHLASYKEDRKFYEVVTYKNSDAASPEEYATYAGNPVIMEKADAAAALDQERLEYVAATRAAEVLIFMAPKEKKGKEESRSFPFRDVAEGSLPDIYDVIEHREPEEEKDFGGAVVYAPEESVQKEAVPAFITLNPSRLASDDEEGGGRKDRPSGNVFGTVMHRCFELLIKRRGKIFGAGGAVQNELISGLIREAMLESSGNIKREDRKLYVPYLTGVMREFLQNGSLVSAIKSAREVHTEMGFSYFIKAGEDPEFRAAIEPYLDGIDIEGKPLWISGAADLVLEMPEGIRILDYKSNVRGDLTPEEFRAYMERKYAGQLLLYRYAMAELYGTDLSKVEAELYLIDGGRNE